MADTEKELIAPKAIGIPTGKPTVLDFSAAWCGGCQTLEESLKAFKPEFDLGKVDLVKVDCDAPENNGLKDRYHITLLPTLVFTDADGKEVTRQAGAARERLDNIHNVANGLAKITNPDGNNAENVQQILQTIGEDNTVKPTSGSQSAEGTHLTIGKRKLSDNELLEYEHELHVQRFLNTVDTLLASPWHNLALKLTKCPDGSNQNDINYYRHKQYQSVAEPRISLYTINNVANGVPYINDTLTRLAVQDTKEFRQERKDFKEIAEYYNFGIEKKPVTITKDWQHETIAGRDDYRMRYIDDGRDFQFTCLANGLNQIRENNIIWSSWDKRREHPSLDANMLNTSRQWLQNTINGDIANPTGIVKKFSVAIDKDKGIVRFFSSDGVREETASGTTYYTKKEWSAKWQKDNAGNASGKDSND